MKDYKTISKKQFNKEKNKFLAKVLYSVTDTDFYKIINQSKTKCKSQNQSQTSQRP